MKKILAILIILNFQLSIINSSTAQRTILFDTHKSEIPYRIPAIAETAETGRLIAVNSYLVNGTDPGFGQVDLHYRLSEDNGKTWSPMKVMAVGNGIKDHHECAYGDAAIVADREKENDVLVVCVTGMTIYWQKTTTRQNPNRIAAIWSHDGGLTFEKPVDITEQIYSLFDNGNVVQSMFVGSGKIMQSRKVKVGTHYRLYAAACARPGGNRVIYSDDFGKTWKALGGASALPVPDGNEPKCEELPDGRVIISSRTSHGRFFNIYTYKNVTTGEGKWDKQVLSSAANNGIAIGGNSCNGEIMLVPAIRLADQKTTIVALQSVPAGDQRTDVTIFYKELDKAEKYATSAAFAANWDGRYQVSDTTSAYSTMTMQKNGRIAFLWEDNYLSHGEKDGHNNDGYDGVYESLSLYDITEGKYAIDPAYEEPHSSATVDKEAWSKVGNNLTATWADNDRIYNIDKVPEVATSQSRSITVWRGERASVEALLYSAKDQGKLHLNLKGWKGVGVADFVNYVICDDYKGCGEHNMNLQTWLAPDIIDNSQVHQVNSCEVRPVWCTLEIPRDAKVGKHALTLEIINEKGKVIGKLALTVNVINRTLPESKDYSFFLNFWQQPYSVSRFYDVPRWSDAHLELLRPYLKMLARAGQKVCTTVLFYEPWGVQSEDKFSPMVQTTCKKDGSWAYDYTIFDKYVQLCEECGISKQINCFSMIPWDMSFQYYDEFLHQDVTLSTKTSSEEYHTLWTNFLRSFAKHLKEKGWFEKTCIAMDERGVNSMLDALKIVEETVPDMKVALAGIYHKELTDKLYDYCLTFRQLYPETELQARKAKGLITTAYTCCVEDKPNIFANSEPVEAVYLPLSTTANGYDGYLHWSWMNWNPQPLTDSRFRLFSSGDTYVIYPGYRSSPRYERFIEGVQLSEKVRILKEEFANNPARLAALNTAYDAFKPVKVDTWESIIPMVNKLKEEVNK